MSDKQELMQQIKQRLSSVLDPETGIDVMRMHLVDELEISEDGSVSYIFRPSTFYCPAAVSLAIEIGGAVAEIEGVSDQEIQVVDYLQAESLNRLLKDFLKRKD